MYDRALSSIENSTGIAVIGCGYWGANYVRVFGELPDSSVLVVCDERPNRLDEVRRRFPGLDLTTEVDEALEFPGVEAVVISTPAQSHYELGKRALRAGKHLLVEKPLTTKVAHADELIELSHQEQRVLLVGHTFLYNPGVQKVKQYLVESILGRLYYLYARHTSLGPIRNDVNAVWDLAPHAIAIFNYLLARKPEWVSAVGARVLGNGLEDVGFISLGYDDDVVGHVHVSWADPHKVREVVVVGSDKRVAFNDLDPLERVRVFDKGIKLASSEEPSTFGEYHFQLRDGDITSPALPATEPLKHVCGHFLHALRRGEAPLTDGRQGRDIVAIMEAIGMSVVQNGVPVEVGLVEDRAAGEELAGSVR